jgi:hypothetical protein
LEGPPLFFRVRVSKNGTKTKTRNGGPCLHLERVGRSQQGGKQKMAISETCKFEFKSRADKIQRDSGVTRNQAIAILADELDLLVETARKMDQRARKELGQIVPRQETLTTTSDSEKLEKLEKTWGGPRQGSGRKPKVEAKPQPTTEEVFRKKYNAFLNEVKKAQAAGWETVPYGVACDLIGDLNNYV